MTEQPDASESRHAKIKTGKPSDEELLANAIEVVHELISRHARHDRLESEHRISREAIQRGLALLRASLDEVLDEPPQTPQSEPEPEGGGASPPHTTTGQALVAPNPTANAPVAVPSQDPGGGPAYQQPPPKPQGWLGIVTAWWHDVLTDKKSTKPKKGE